MAEDTLPIAQAKEFFNGGQWSNEKWRAHVGEPATTKLDLASVEGGFNRSSRSSELQREAILGNRERVETVSLERCLDLSNG